MKSQKVYSVSLDEKLISEVDEARGKISRSRILEWGVRMLLDVKRDAKGMIDPKEIRKARFGK